jgi:hypothetical protein
MIAARSLAALLAAAVAVAAAAQDKAAVDAGPYVSSPDSAVAAMLREAGVGPGDYVIDLGSGDGRIVRTAAKVFGARGMGVEIQEPLVALSNELARKEGIADRVRFVNQDLFRTDISPATVVTLYLLPHTVSLLRDKLLDELRPGARIVSHDYGISGWRADRSFEMDLEEKVAISGVTRTVIHLYVVPAKVAGAWSATVPPALGRGTMRLELAQQVASVSGHALLGGARLPLQDVRLSGDSLTFALAGRREVFRGRVSGDVIEGTVEARGKASPWRATRRRGPAAG